MSKALTIKVSDSTMAKDTRQITLGFAFIYIGLVAFGHINYGRMLQPSSIICQILTSTFCYREERGKIPGTAENYLVGKLRIAHSVIYTLVSALFKADESCSGGK
jgi:hypothetical protein